MLHDRDVPHIHNLVDLEKLCEEIEPRFSELYLQCAALTRYGVAPKYPRKTQVDTDDAKRAIAYAKIVRDFVRARFPGYFSGGVSHA